MKSIFVLGGFRNPATGVGDCVGGGASVAGGGEAGPFSGGGRTECSAVGTGEGRMEGSSVGTGEGEAAVGGSEGTGVVRVGGPSEGGDGSFTSSITILFRPGGPPRIKMGARKRTSNPRGGPTKKKARDGGSSSCAQEAVHF